MAGKKFSLFEVILSVICEELRADPKDIQIKSIRRL